MKIKTPKMPANMDQIVESWALGRQFKSGAMDVVIFSRLADGKFMVSRVVVGTTYHEVVSREEAAFQYKRLRQMTAPWGEPLDCYKPHCVVWDEQPEKSLGQRIATCVACKKLAKDELCPDCREEMNAQCDKWAEEDRKYMESQTKLYTCQCCGKENSSHKEHSFCPECHKLEELDEIMKVERCLNNGMHYDYECYECILYDVCQKFLKERK